jgi:hypothetical protein
MWLICKRPALYDYGTHSTIKSIHGDVLKSCTYLWFKILSIRQHTMFRRMLSAWSSGSLRSWEANHATCTCCYKNIHGPYSFSFSSLHSTSILRTMHAYTCTISFGWSYFHLTFSGYIPFDRFPAHLDQQHCWWGSMLGLTVPRLLCLRQTCSTLKGTATTHRTRNRDNSSRQEACARIWRGMKCAMRMHSKWSMGSVH